MHLIQIACKITKSGQKNGHEFLATISIRSDFVFVVKRVHTGPGNGGIGKNCLFCTLADIGRVHGKKPV